MERDEQIERMKGAERRAAAFFERCLSTPKARAILDRGNVDRPPMQRGDAHPSARTARG